MEEKSIENKVDEPQSGSVIFVVKVTTNKEDKAVDMIAEKVQKKKINIYSLARPHGLKGYIILEASDRETAEEAAFNLPYVKGIIGKTVNYEEIKNMLQPKVEDIKIEVGDIVEMTGSTFKGEKAKVTRVEKQKGEVVVSLLGASVPIPVTVKIDSVKVIRRDDKAAEEADDDKSKNDGDDLTYE